RALRRPVGHSIPAPAEAPTIGLRAELSTASTPGRRPGRAAGRPRAAPFVAFVQRPAQMPRSEVDVGTDGDDAVFWQAEGLDGVRRRVRHGQEELLAPCA